ncbi:predicted protein [Nematostella vectensis]|uniref:Uncharacterized protein n=1 Tax=Nematostella vectensis TaxID=45351 RepID=A7T3R2_NEMVE|nr:steroid 17-alpha-hydroxylase/17,20 lyase [Nematostella vectensis]EDO29403.1 predicted protein [Nematostella vectensis]|eukprot:XP_001621503.1 hypothetical protein NEMVEDRAFT_v1g221914 [Nematostella vectensis]
MIELCVPALLISLALIYIFYSRKERLPPGPAPWPIIGNLDLLIRKEALYKTFTNLSHKYGGVFRLYLGSKPVVVLNGKAIYDSLARQPSVFAGRPTLPPSLDFGMDPDYGVLDYGPLWKFYKKLGHSAVRVHGTDRLNEAIRVEVDEVCRRLDSLDGQPVDISKEFGIATTNVICARLFGSRYDVHDPEFLRIYEIHNKISRVVMSSRSLSDVFPFLVNILPESKERRELRELLQERYTIIWRKYKEHEQTFTPGVIRDYTDLLIDAKLSEKNSHKLTENGIISTGLASQFLAGSETTASTLSWSVVYLLNDSDVQERIHNELDDVIGKGQLPQLSHKKKLPVLEAFTAETLRLSCIGPLGMPHKTTRDTFLRGHAIPKGTTVVPNLWSLHHDSTEWKDPFKFDINRFLEDGVFRAPANDAYLPFSAGPRVCLGEELARSELFLFLARLLQKFDFVTPLGLEVPSLDAEDSGIVLHPKPFLACARRRKFSTTNENKLLPTNNQSRTN